MQPAPARPRPLGCTDFLAGHEHQNPTWDSRGTISLLPMAGAYGLPQLKGAQGFKVWDEFEEDFTFQYPRAWVPKRNTLRGGVIISDFNTGRCSGSSMQAPAAGVS